MKPQGLKSMEKKGESPLAAKPSDQVQEVSENDVNPRSSKADKAMGDAGVKTPWQNSHQITQGGQPHWEAHHQNSQGLKGQASWEHKGAKRGGTQGPQQRNDPYRGEKTWDGTDQNQTY